MLSDNIDNNKNKFKNSKISIQDQVADSKDFLTRPRKSKEEGFRALYSSIEPVKKKIELSKEGEAKLSDTLQKLINN